MKNLCNYLSAGKAACALSIFSLSILSASAGASRRVVYEYIRINNSSKKSQSQNVSIEQLDSGKRLFKRVIKSDDSIQEEEFILNNDYETESFEVRGPGYGDSYSGIVKDDKLIIKGRVSDKAINKIIDLDGIPFYFSPKFNLSKFAVSDLKQLKFYTFRRDTQDKQLMLAEKSDRQITDLGAGNNIDLLKVNYSAVGLAGRFYKRIYYFRASDGVFIKNETPSKNKDSLVLISEERG